VRQRRKANQRWLFCFGVEAPWPTARSHCAAQRKRWLRRRANGGRWRWAAPSRDSAPLCRPSKQRAKRMPNSLTRGSRSLTRVCKEHVFLRFVDRISPG
jgi:hypothetical protein